MRMIAAVLLLVLAAGTTPAAAQSATGRSRRICQRRRSGAGFNACMRAAMTTAASTGWGKRATSGIANKTSAPSPRAAMKPVHLVCAPAASAADPALRRRHREWHEQLARLVAQFRSNYGRHVGEPAWTGFISALQAASPHFARLWEAHDVASPVTYLKVFRHPAFPRLVMTSTSLGILAVPCTRIVVYTPADEETRTAISKLLDGDGTDAQYPCAPAHARLRAELAAASAR